MAGNSDADVNDDDLNLYDDLLVEEEEQLRKLRIQKEQQFGDLEKETVDQRTLIHELQTEMLSVRRENGILRRNISCLYKTAKAEIERKDDLLRELQRRYDEIVFRRTKVFLGRPAISSDDSAVSSSSVPTQSSVIYKKRPIVPSETSDSPRKKHKRHKVEDVESPCTVTTVDRDSSVQKTTVTPSKVVCDLRDEERILSYTASAAVTKKTSSKKRSRARRHDDNSVNNASSGDHLEAVVLQNGKPDDVKRKNGRCFKIEPKSLERYNDENIESLDGHHSEHSRPSRATSFTAGRQTLIAKTLERRRSKQLPSRINSLDKYQRHVGRTKVVDSHDRQYSKSSANEKTTTVLPSSLEICQNVRGESRCTRGNQNLVNVGSQSLERYWGRVEQSKSLDNNKTLVPKLKLLANEERGILISKVKLSVNCEDEIPEDKSSIGCGERLDFACGSPEDCRDGTSTSVKDLDKLSSRVKKTSMTDSPEGQPDTKRKSSHGRKVETSQVMTSNFKDFQRKGSMPAIASFGTRRSQLSPKRGSGETHPSPSSIGVRANRDSRVVEERGARIPKVSSPVRRGSRTSGTSFRSQQSSSKVDQRVPRRGTDGNRVKPSVDNGRSFKEPRSSSVHHRDNRLSTVRDSSRKEPSSRRSKSGHARRETDSRFRNSDAHFKRREDRTKGTLTANGATEEPSDRSLSHERTSSGTNHKRNLSSVMKDARDDLEDGEIPSDGGY